MTSTAEKLAKALQEVGAPERMIREAKEGYYDDYRSPLAFPQTALVEECKIHGLDGIVQRVINGEFDGTKEEADAWAKSEEGQETFKEFFNASE